MRIGCLQFSPVKGEVDNNLSRADAVLLKADPSNLDLLVLPELAFSSHSFQSSQEILPYLEHSKSGISSLWARTTALKYGCTVIVGYPEKVDLASGPEHYNSALIINGDGDTVGNYRKSHTHQYDEAWARPGTGFYRSYMPDHGRVALGISMDIGGSRNGNSRQGYEFAYHILEVNANLVVLTMSWATNETPETFTEAPYEPDMDALMFWVSRLEPIIRAEKQEEVIVVVANRSGMEGGLTYAGTSLVLGVLDGSVRLYGVLGRCSKELLVVDTDEPCIGYLVYRPDGAGVPTNTPKQSTKTPQSSSSGSLGYSNDASQTTATSPATSSSNTDKSGRSKKRNHVVFGNATTSPRQVATSTSTSTSSPPPPHTSSSQHRSPTFTMPPVTTASSGASAKTHNRPQLSIRTQLNGWSMVKSAPVQHGGSNISDSHLAEWSRASSRAGSTEPRRLTVMMEGNEGSATETEYPRSAHPVLENSNSQYPFSPVNYRAKSTSPGERPRVTSPSSSHGGVSQSFANSRRAKLEQRERELLQQMKEQRKPQNRSAPPAHFIEQQQQQLQQLIANDSQKEKEDNLPETLAVMDDTLMDDSRSAVSGYTDVTNQTNTTEFEMEAMLPDLSTLMLSSYPRLGPREVIEHVRSHSLPELDSASEEAERRRHHRFGNGQRSHKHSRNCRHRHGTDGETEHQQQQQQQQHHHRHHRHHHHPNCRHRGSSSRRAASRESLTDEQNGNCSDSWDREGMYASPPAPPPLPAIPQEHLAWAAAQQAYAATAGAQEPSKDRRGLQAANDNPYYAGSKDPKRLTLITDTNQVFQSSRRQPSVDNFGGSSSARDPDPYVMDWMNSARFRQMRSSPALNTPALSASDVGTPMNFTPATPIHHGLYYRAPSASSTKVGERVNALGLLSRIGSPEAMMINDASYGGGTPSMRTGSNLSGAQKLPRHQRSRTFSQSKSSGGAMACPQEDHLSELPPHQQYHPEQSALLSSYPQQQPIVHQGRISSSAAFKPTRGGYAGRSTPQAMVLHS